MIDESLGGGSRRPVASWLACLGLVAFGCATSQNAPPLRVERQTIDVARPAGPFSGGVVVDNMLFTSGQIGTRPNTKQLVAGGIGAEMQQAMENLAAVLGHAGFAMADIVRCDVYLKSLDDYAEMDQVYRTFFGDGQFPSRACVEVSNLMLGASVEVSCIAVKGVRPRP
jgi:2-iminobutanoate/2-iminopropanoate deaminase